MDALIRQAEGDENELRPQRDGRPQDGQTRTFRRIRFWSKTDALDKLARHLGMLVDRHEVEGGKGNLILNIKVGPPEPKEEGSHGGDGLARDTVIDGESQPEASLLRNGRGH